MGMGVGVAWAMGMGAGVEVAMGVGVEVAMGVGVEVAMGVGVEVAAFRSLAILRSMVNTSYSPVALSPFSHALNSDALAKFSESLPGFLTRAHSWSA